MAGAASGGWFTEGVPVHLAFTLPYTYTLLFMGPLQERDDIRVLSHENGWFPSFLGLGVVDLADPKWEDITPATGPVWLRLWRITRDGGPDIDEPRGGVLVEILEAERLRIEWFDTHEEVAEFTACARGDLSVYRYPAA